MSEETKLNEYNGRILTICYISCHFLVPLQLLCSSYAGKADDAGCATEIQKDSLSVKPGRRCVSCMSLCILCQL